LSLLNYKEYGVDGLTEIERERQEKFKNEIERLKNFNIEKLMEEFAKSTGPIKLDRRLEEEIRVCENRINGYLNFFQGYRAKTTKVREQKSSKIQIIEGGFGNGKY